MMRQSNHALYKVLSSVQPSDCPSKYNFHTHTICSDGSLTPKELITQAIDKRLLQLAVTDHHNIDAYEPMNDVILKNKSLGVACPKLWTGIEITCLLSKCLVHILGLGFHYRHESLARYTKSEAEVGKYLRAEHVIDSIHDAGGLAILAHPARYRLTAKELVLSAFESGCDGAEAWYDYDSKSSWEPTPIVCEKIARQLADLGMLSSCGTDTHGLSLYGR